MQLIWLIGSFNQGCLLHNISLFSSLVRYGYQGCYLCLNLGQSSGLDYQNGLLNLVVIRL